METITEPAGLLQARMPDRLIRRLRSLAGARGCPPRDLLIEALEKYLPRAEKRAETALRGNGDRRKARLEAAQVVEGSR